MKMYLWSAVVGSIVGVCVGTLPAFAQGPPPPPTPSEAAAQLRNASKAELAALKAALSTNLSGFETNLSTHLLAVGGGSATPQQSLENAAGNLVDAMNALRDKTNLAERNLEAQAAGLLRGLGGTDYPLGFLVGDAQTLDKFVAAIGKEVGKNRAKFLKDMQKFARGLSSAEYTILAWVPDLGDTAPPSPNPGPAPAAGALPLAIHGIAAGAGSMTANDGKICVGGLADAAGGSLTVTITGPAATTQTQTVTVTTSGRWYACFPPIGTAGNLSEGNYTVQATQGTTTPISTSAAIGVPE
ncbi:MAG: hypothetical protein L0323_11580 [Planctomycetes bacterium]|nr:hypothetical protein [Planctomycetota bacterium]